MQDNRLYATTEFNDYTGTCAIDEHALGVRSWIITFFKPFNSKIGEIRC